MQRPPRSFIITSAIQEISSPESGTSKQAWWLNGHVQLDHQELHDYSEEAPLAPCKVWARLGGGTELGRVDEVAVEERILLSE